MKGKLIIVALFIVAAAVVVKLGTRRQDPVPLSDGESKIVAKDTVALPVVYSTEKKAWLEAAAAAFAAEHPTIKVELIGKGSVESANAVLDEKIRPVLWSPADSLVLRMLANDWQTKNHEPLFAETGEDTPQPVLLTPLVFVAWEDRASALQKAGAGALSWKVIRQAAVAAKGWPAVGGQGRWGFVKLGHTDPTKSNSGLQALYLMALESSGKNRLAVEDLLAPKTQDFIRGIEKAVTKFEASTGTFMTDMVRFGPSKYDIAAVYEASAIAELGNAEGRWGKLRVYYPSTTIWSDHPMALLRAPWVTEPQKAAARTFLAFLRSKSMQERALEFGFRPADTSVKILGGDPRSPFTRLASFGVAVDLPPAAEIADGALVRNLLIMWTRMMQP